MEKLLEISQHMDAEEIYPLVVKFAALKEDNADIGVVYENINLAKQATKKMHLINFYSALQEAIAIFNDFSAIEDDKFKGELLQSCRDSTQFYLNRIIKEAKEKGNDLQIQWSRSLEEFLSSANGGKGSGSMGKSGGSSAIRSSSSTAPIQEPNIVLKKVKKAPRKELVGNIWYVENYSNDQEIALEIYEMQQRVVISNCEESILKISGKCTAISLEQSKKMGVVVNGVIVSTFEVLNSSRLQIQLNFTCPTMTMDNCEGVQVFLGSGVDAQFELLTSRCNEVNLYRQESTEFSNEIPVPEQFKSYFDAESGALKTEAVRHTSA